MKVLFIPKWYPSRVHEQNGDFIRRHALAVATKHQVAVLFISADPNMKNKTYDAEFETDTGITTVRIFYNNSLSDFFIFSSLVKLFRYLRSCYIGIKIINGKFGIPDISHVHVLARTFLPAYYYNFFYKTPFIVSEQWSGYLPEDGMYKGFLKKILTKIAIRKASAVTTVSETLKNAMLSHSLKKNYFIIPNVVNTNLFFPSAENKKKNKFTLLHVSNLYDRAKNVSGMIEAVKKISEGRNDFEFHIVGDGYERYKFEEASKNYNLLDSIIFFHGFKERSDLAEMMRNADVCLLFSNYETISCVMIESFASGVPVIGSSIPALQEHVKEEMGILVQPHDENALCEAISKALDATQLFDKNKLHQYAQENFSYEVVAKQFDILYQKIILN